MTDVDDGGTALPGFLAFSPATRRLAELARRAALSAPTVLVTGESGSGKSTLARALHAVARGDEAPLAVVDCASLSEELAENELFGHEAGAYSGAADRQPGRFEAANGGTVLLDRVSDLPLSVQGKLLRVLQERSFERVGGTRTVSVDVRLVATSSEDLVKLARRGLFREDLYFRLDVVRLEVPPLRERPEDIEGLARVFAARLGRVLSDAAMSLLVRHAFPGNVRELQNVLERAAAASEDPRIPEDAVREALRSEPPRPDKAIAALAEARLSLDEIERLYIERVLRATGGRIAEAAAVLGIHRKTLLEKRRRHGLP